MSQMRKLGAKDISKLPEVNSHKIAELSDKQFKESWTTTLESLSLKENTDLDKIETHDIF